MAIDGERLRRIRDLFEAALPLDPGSRRSFLDAECADASLRAEVEAILDASGGDGELGIEGLIPASSRFRAGDAVGPYTIVERIGRGGIGEVYRARDQKLEKDVAIKVLSPEFSKDESRFARFRSEARTLAALNHPNIVVIHHAGEFEGSWFLVMEFVNGETLADRIRRGPIPVGEALRIAADIAGALEAAHEHEMRIVHRDLKPANIMIAGDGSAKVLDFGLSQPLGPPAGPSSTGPSTGASGSRYSVMAVEGTPPYMSPEQLRGEAPHRSSDIWAFGCVLYEMLAGRPAFPGDGPDILAEILKGEPDWSLLPAETPPEIVRLARRCLTKDRRGRLRDIGDARIEVEEAMASPGGGAAAPAPRAALPLPGPVRKSRMGLWLGLVALGALVAVLIALKTSPDAPPSYRQISFRRGTVWRARFSPDGRTVVYSATWNGGPIETYSTRGDSSSTRLEFQDADLLAVSSRDELALLQQPSFLWWFIGAGTLASASLGGGAPRALLADVQEADWAPDGMELAVTRNLGGRNQLEYPIGKALYETSGYISSPRVSPSGDLVAFLDHPIQSDNRGWVTTVDSAGNRKVLSGEWGAVEGLAWSPDGREVWFSGNRGGESSGIYAVSLAGAERVVARGPGNWVLQDVSRDGRALVAASPITVTMGGLGADDAVEQDLSWLDFAGLVALSDDGSTYIFTHWGEGSGPNYSTYLRKTDGAPAVRLGEGAGLALSPDGKWVLTLSLGERKIALLPTGPGEARTLDTPGIEEFGFRAAWFPDGERILFNGRDSAHAVRAYVAPVDGSSPPVPVTPEGVTASVISSDGRFVVGTDAAGSASLYPLDGGPPQFIPGLDPYDRIIGWSADPRVVHIARYGQGELQAVRLDVWNGFRQTLKRIHVTDTAGMTWPPEMLFTPDGSRFVYQTTRTLSTLYIVEGLR